MFSSRAFYSIVLACAAAGLASCADTTRFNGTRVPTVPVNGELFVDGNPAEGVEIRAIPVEKLNLQGAELGLSAITDTEGKFSLHTYDRTDGLPKGEYALTFSWIPLGSKYLNEDPEPDRLNGKYATVETSPKKVLVEKGRKLDLGRIELTTQ